MLLSDHIYAILPNLSFYLDAAPVFVLLIAGIITMIIGGFSSPLKPNKLSASVAILALIISVLFGFVPVNNSGTFFSGSVVIDGISVISCFVIALGTLFTFLCAMATKTGKNFLRSEITTLLLFSSAGLMIIAMSGDFISFFIGLEITSLCSYVLVGYLKPHFVFEANYSNPAQAKGLEASIKYFILGSAASALILMGVAFIYATLGNIYFSDLYNLDFKNPFAMLGLIFTLCGLAFKLGMAPFHAWVPDVYEGANSHFTAYMASMIKFALVMILIRILGSFSQGHTVLPKFFIVLGVFSIVIGSLFGLAQNSIKRLLAYSSIANVGYLCLAFTVLAQDPNNLVAKQALFIYMFIYTFLSLGAFHVLAWFEDGHSDDLLREELAGIGKVKPFAAFALSVFLFGLAGIPPLAGFFGKLVLIITAVQNGLTWFAILLVVFSCFSLFYYLNLMVEMWFKSPNRYSIAPRSQSRHTNILMTVMSTFAMIIVIGVGLFGI